MVSIHTGLSALNAFATGVQGTAYNIANINTAGFQPVSVDYRSGRPADHGVRPVVTRPPADTTVSATPAAGQSVPVSHVNEAREMTKLIVNQRSFEANAVVIRASDDLIGTLIDLKI